MSGAARIPDPVGLSSGLILRDEPTRLNPKGGWVKGVLAKREALEDVWSADPQHLGEAANWLAVTIGQ
jgi:hypothetical protein